MRSLLLVFHVLEGTHFSVPEDLIAPRNAEGPHKAAALRSTVVRLHVDAGDRVGPGFLRGGLQSEQWARHLAPQQPLQGW